MSFLNLHEKAPPEDSNTKAIVPIDDVKKIIFEKIINRLLNKDLFKDFLTIHTTCKHWSSLVNELPSALFIKASLPFKVFRLRNSARKHAGEFAKKNPHVPRDMYQLYADENLLKASEYKVRAKALEDQLKKQT